MDIASDLTRNTLDLLNQALQALCRLDYVFVDLPWIVDKEHSDATRPSTSRDFETPYGSLVASGEQSFLQLYFESRLTPRGMRPGYVGWTPCFRDEPQLDVLHRPAFVKVEWFAPRVPLNYGKTLQARIYEQIGVFRDLATYCGMSYHDATENLELASTGEDAWDIQFGGVEIGSYGFRTFNGLNYLYGTGLALPRFTQAILPWIKS